MAIIKLKRIKAERGSQTINAGELAIAGTKLYYGGADIDVNATGITPTQVAGTNISNIFTQQNTFSGTGTTISIVDGSGNENYRVENGRLVAMYPSGFAFNQNDLVDRSYVDASAQGLKPHPSVKAASTANVTIAAAPATLDGITLTAGDRLLLKNQTTANENGIYVFNGVGVALTRATDMDAAWDDEVFRAYVFVDQGSTQGNSSWVTSVGKGGTVGSTAITWAQFSVVGGAVADEISLTKAANVFSIKAGAVTPGDFTVDGQLTIGTAGETWSIDGSGADMVFTGGSYTATLPAPTATRTTIAYTSDLPAGVDVISCATAAATAQKDITVANYAEADGKQLYVDFTYANTAASPTLRVNTLTARAIYINGAAAASGSWAGGDVLRLAFDAVNNRYHILENLTTRQYYGNAATTTKLATPRSLKVALGSTAAVTFDGSAAQDSIPVSGTLPIANGGTGQTTANAAFNALSPMTTAGDIIYGAASGAANRLAGNTTATNKFLRSVSSGIPSWEAVTKADVGLSAVENTALSTWAGTSNITTLGTVVTGTWGASTIAVNKGGTGQTSYTNGQLLIGNSTGNTLVKATLTATANQTKITNGAGSITVGLADNIVTAGTLQTGGELTVGTDGGSWSIDGLTVNKLRFNYGTQIYELPNDKVAGTYTIATTADVPSTLTIYQSDTAAATTPKTLTVANIPNFTAVSGIQLFVKFTNANTAAATQITIDGVTTALNLNGAQVSATNTWTGANQVLRIEYNGTSWDILENLTSRQYYGNATTSSAATLIATSQKSDNATYQIPFVNGVAAGNKNLYTDSAADITYNPSSGNLTATKFNALTLSSLADGFSIAGGTASRTLTVQTGNVTLTGNSAGSTLVLPSGTTALAAAATYGVTDSTSAAAIGTATSLVTERDVYYGLPNINGGHSYSSNTSIYAPTAQLAASAATAYLVGASATNSISTVYSNSAVYMNNGTLYATQFEGVIDGGTTWA